jgi:hypothetical protein
MQGIIESIKPPRKSWSFIIKPYKIHKTVIHFLCTGGNFMLQYCCLENKILDGGINGKKVLSPSYNKICNCKSVQNYQITARNLAMPKLLL